MYDFYDESDDEITTDASEITSELKETQALGESQQMIEPEPLPKKKKEIHEEIWRDVVELKEKNAREMAAVAEQTKKDRIEKE